MSTSRTIIFDQPSEIKARSRAFLSGSAWFRKYQAQFPNSRKIGDLELNFRQKVKPFIKALRDDGATVKISSTPQHRERVWVMRYAWKVARVMIRPSRVPKKSRVLIIWTLGKLLTSRRAARLNDRWLRFQHGPHCQ